MSRGSRYLTFDHFTDGDTILIVFVDLARFRVPNNHRGRKTVHVKSETIVHDYSLHKVVVLIVSQGTIARDCVELVLPHPILDERFMKVRIVHRHAINILQIVLLYLRL